MRAAALAVLLLVALASAGRLGSVRSFAVYYGSNPEDLDKLSGYDLLILSPLLPGETVSRLKGGGSVLVGYVSLSTVGGWEPWAGKVPENAFLGRLEAWNERVVDPCSGSWRRVLLEYAVPYVLGKGFDGVFLDNLDVADLYPEKKECIAGLVKSVRERFPGAVIVVNRGFSVLEEIAPYIDAVLFESFTTYYDFSSKKYRTWSGGDKKWVEAQAERLAGLRKKHGLLVLALGYADLGNETMINEYCDLLRSEALRYGFPAYLASVNLDKPGVDCSPKPQRGGGKRYSTRPPAGEKLHGEAVERGEEPVRPQLVALALAAIAVAVAIMSKLLRSRSRTLGETDKELGSRLTGPSG